jgi:hypothetical protein
VIAFSCDRVVFSSCLGVLPIFFIIHGFVVNKSVLLCGFKQTKGKRHENSDSFDRTAAGIGHSVCVNHLWPVVAGWGGMNQCKHRWLLTPSPHRTQYHYQCARCNQVAWANLKEKQS